MTALVREAVTLFFRPLRLALWRVRWLRWWLGRPYRLGDPALGKIGPERDRNREILWERYNAREPRRPE